MSHILSVLRIGEFCEFSTLFNTEEGRLGVVVTFLAILELCKDSAIDIIQAELFAPIYLKARSASMEGSADSDAVMEGSDDSDAVMEGSDDTTDAASDMNQEPGPVAVQRPLDSE
jgi:segregation and condensation protein A